MLRLLWREQDLLLQVRVVLRLRQREEAEGLPGLHALLRRHLQRPAVRPLLQGAGPVLLPRPDLGLSGRRGDALHARVRGLVSNRPVRRGASADACGALRRLCFGFCYPHRGCLKRQGVLCSGPPLQEINRN